MIDSLGNVQSVLLVGGTSEIGQAILERLAQGGRLQRIVLLGRNESALEQTAEAWRDRGLQTQVIMADLRGELDVPVLTGRCFDDGDIGEPDSRLRAYIMQARVGLAYFVVS